MEGAKDLCRDTRGPVASICYQALLHIKEPLDHRILNEVLPFNPTAENLARWCVERVPFCYKATVQESEGNIATYEIEEP